MLNSVLGKEKAAEARLGGMMSFKMRVEDDVRQLNNRFMARDVRR